MVFQFSDKTDMVVFMLIMNIMLMAISIDENILMFYKFQFTLEV